jgi:hypothetical protein
VKKGGVKTSILIIKGVLPMFVDRNLVQRLKDTYPAGTRIVLDFMGDDPRPIEPGAKGTVRIVDDIGTVHCDFDNGRRLGLVPGEDSFHVDLEQEKEKNIQVVLSEPGKKARVTTIQNNLASLQKMVGGYIEAVYPFEDPVGIICNEESKINGMELNRALRDDQGNIYDILTGPFLVVGLGEEDFASLSKGLQEKYCKLFEHPEVFFRVGNI